MTAKATPADVKIPPRDIRFDFEGAKARRELFGQPSQSDREVADLAGGAQRGSAREVAIGERLRDVTEFLDRTGDGAREEEGDGQYHDKPEKTHFHDLAPTTASRGSLYLDGSSFTHFRHCEHSEAIQCGFA